MHSCLKFFYVCMIPFYDFASSDVNFMFCVFGSKFDVGSSKPWVKVWDQIWILVFESGTKVQQICLFCCRMFFHVSLHASAWIISRKFALWPPKSPLVPLGPNQLNNFINLVLGSFNFCNFIACLLQLITMLCLIALNSWF